MKSIINFIKYHNAFTIGFGLVLFLTAGAFASENVRDAVIGEKVENVQGVDNSLILATDLDNFDFRLVIKEVKEDANNYYLGYDYQALAIQDNIWQKVLKNNTMTVSRERLRDRDLGLYAQGELGENLDRELKYLKEVQVIERANGATQLVVSTDYTGLVGLVLNIREKLFPGYEPVVKQTAGEPFSQTSEVSSPTSEVNAENGSPDIPQICRNGENRPCSSQIGACRIGVEICTDGAWGDCIGAVFPTDEILDLVDNNCDGQIDEGLITGEPFSPTSEVSAPTSEVNVENGSLEISSSTELIVETATSTEQIATSTSQ